MARAAARRIWGQDSDNMRELRRSLVGPLAAPLIVFGSIVAGLVLPRQYFPNPWFRLSFAALGLGLLVLAVQFRWPRLASHLLVWGGGALYGLATLTLPDPWLPYLAVPLAVAGAAVLPGSEWAVCLGASVWISWLNASGYRADDLPALLGMLLFSTAITWIALRVFRVALHTSWDTEQHAGEMLAEARARQGDQASLLKSLEITTRALEQANLNLAAARRQADDARRMKEQFAANISHELRTPLNLILGFSEMMYLSPEVYGDLPWPPALRRDIYQVHRSSRHLLELIDDILDLSRFELAGFTLNKEWTDLPALMESAIDIVSGLFRGRPVTLEWSAEAGLPMLDIDRTRIRQVMLNLLGNARRHTETGTVRLTAGREGGEVVISVSDTGAGIPADKLPHVFDEFYRADESLRRKPGGAGLGLAISKRFVQAHEGRMWAESREGAGSAFYFSLPLPAGGTHTLYPKYTPAAPAAASGDRPRIVVEDRDPAVVALIRRHLAGFDVIPAGEDEPGARPVAVVRNVRPGALARRSAAPAAPAWTGKAADVPVLECSLPSGQWLAEDLSIGGVLHKPIAAGQLLAEIDRLGGASGAVSDILVVDDDRGFCQLVERMLSASRRGFVVRRAYDGEEGLAALHARPPHLVLLDLTMPKMNGFELIAAMRQDSTLAAIPVVLLTVTSYADDLLRHAGNQLMVTRPGGLPLPEVLACLRGVAGALDALGK